MISPRRPGRLLVAAALIGLAGFPPSAARAASAVPAENVVAIDGQTQSAIVGDVDGDGVRELVRIVPVTVNPTQLAVDVLREMTGGGVSRLPQVALRREQTPEDRDVIGRGEADADGMYPVQQGDPVRLLAWRDGEREHVLAAALGLQTFGACCLTLWDVTLNRFGVPDLRLLAETHRAASAVVAIDLDGDGIDEIAVAAPSVTVDIFRWDGSGFADTGISFARPPLGSQIVDVGDSDGISGNELVVVAPVPLDDQPAVLERMSLDQFLKPRTDVVEVPFQGIPVGIPGDDHARIAVVSASEGTALVDMPPGGRADISTSSRRGVPLGVLGSGDDARLLLLRDDSAVDVLDGTLSSRQGFHGAEAAAIFVGSPLPPFVGELSGGLPSGEAAIVFRGAMAQAPGPTSPRSGFLAARPVAVLPGKTPIGAFGARGAWMGIADTPAMPVDRRLAVMARGAGGGAMVVVAPSAEVLTAEADGGEVRPSLVDAVRVETQPARPIIAARGAFEIETPAPPGSLVVLDAANPARSGTTRANFASVATLRVEPVAGPAATTAFSARLLVATPGGHGYGASWEVRILRDPPPLSAAADGAPLSTRVTVHGTTAPGATLTIDGSGVDVAADGTFSAEIAAGLLPRDVELVAADVVGNTSRTRVSVVAFLDYRDLPWIPIVAVLTLLMGGLLFLRTPRLRAPDPGDDATLEELA